jgi:hypothetical protein
VLAYESVAWTVRIFAPPALTALFARLRVTETSGVPIKPDPLASQASTVWRNVLVRRTWETVSNTVLHPAYLLDDVLSTI